MWEKAKGVLKESLGESVYGLWIEPLECIQSEADRIQLACPDRFFRAHLDRNHLAHVQETVNDVCGTPCKVTLCDKEAVTLPPASPKGQLRLPHMPKGKSVVRSLHPRYTFDAFMVGESNLLAQSACRSMVNGDDHVGSCLYINSSTGLGKSHLTHAVAHSLLAESPSTRLRYVTAQQFASEMVRGIQSGSMDQFKSSYHDQCDFLLVEDVHALQGKKKTQEELNELLDSLIKRGKRVILTAKSSPRGLKGVDSEFCSRMGSGLVTTIQAPDLATRHRIVEHKAARSGLSLAEEAISYISNQIHGDVRRIESTLLALNARAGLNGGRVDMDMVREVVADVIGLPKDLTTALIAEMISREYRVSYKDLQSRSRKKAITFPRQVAMYLGRKHTEESLADIGKTFKRNHATVLHAVKVVSELCRRDTSVQRQVELLDKKMADL
ncbi:MAG: chromosomal replication initiator protein DnaA [Thermodesulfobacteriota bacterium]